jgi:hypothetical protein
MRATYSVLYLLPLALASRFAYSDLPVAKLAKIGGIKMNKITELISLNLLGAIFC